MGIELKKLMLAIALICIIIIAATVTSQKITAQESPITGTGSDSRIRVQIFSVSTSSTIPYYPYQPPNSEFIWACVDMSIENIGSPNNISSNYLFGYLMDSKNNKHQGMGLAADPQGLKLANLTIGNSERGNIYFEIPSTASIASLQWYDYASNILISISNASPTPTVTPSPTPTVTPSPTPTVTPSPTPTVTPNSPQTLNSSATNYAIPATITIGVGSPILALSAYLMYRRKNKQKTTYSENKLERTPYDVFISYSNQDKNVANALCATLESRKIKCWIAPRDVKVGMDWPSAIIQALNNARIFVLVFSSNSNKSNQSIREVERAVSKGMYIIPLRIENIEPSGSMEYLLSVPHWLDAMTPPLEQHLQKLADTVQMLLGNKEEHSDSNPPKN